MPLLDIRPDHLKMVQDILQQHVPEREVWAFGSRAKWLAKEYSDLDLCIVGDSPLSFHTLGLLQEDFAESDLPWKVDVVDWATTSESFRKIIERDRVVVQKGSGRRMATMRISEISARTAVGPFGSRMKSDTYISSGVPVIRGTNLTGGKCFSGDWVFVSEQAADQLGNCCVQSNDLVFPHRGAIGEVGLVPSDFPRYVMSSSLMMLSCDLSKADPSYVYYFFKSNEGRHELLKNASQVGTPGIGQPLSTLRGIELHVPSLKEQAAVARILGSLDDKIDLNRRINQTLETMAQALFKSWFVDFDPVKAKIAAKQALTPALAQGEREEKVLRAAMCAISGKTDAELDALKNQKYVGWVSPEQSGGRNPTHNADDTISADALGYGYRLTQPTPDEMSAYDQLAALAALFPDEMEDPEVGEIPRGWVFKSVVDIAQFANGKVDASSLNEDIYISTENMLENRAGITRATSLPSLVTVPSFKVGQILISNIRPYFKKIWMARFDGGRSPDVLAFEPSNPQWAEFLYNLMYQDSFFEFMTRTAKGAKMPRGDKNAIMGWTFPCPDEALMIYFSEKVRPHYEHIESLNSENKSLATLRDTLLPKLLSGELSVNTASETISGLETE